MPAHALGPRGGIGAYDDTEVDAEGKLSVRLDGSPEETADLTRPECLRAILERLKEGDSVQEIVLVHDRERSYGARALAVLDGLLRVARVLDRLAQREPNPDFPGFTAKEVAATCAECPYRPDTVFSALRDRLMGDPEGFLTSFRALADELAAYREEGCGPCVSETVQDLRVLLNEIGEVGR